MADARPHHTPDLTWLLSRLVESVPHTQSALLASADGIPKCYHGLDREGAERLAACASGLCALARDIGRTYGDGDDVRQFNVQVGGLAVFLTAAGAGTNLIVLAAPDVQAGTLGYEMVKLGRELPTYLATPARHDTALQAGHWA